MQISVALGKQERFNNYEVDLNPEMLKGQFQTFDKLDGKWQAMAAAARQKTVEVSAQGKTYRLVSLDSEGNFSLEPK